MIISKLYNKFISLNLFHNIVLRCISTYSYFYAYDSISIKTPSSVNPPYIRKIEFFVVNKEKGDLSALATNSSQYSHLVSSLCSFLLSADFCYSTITFTVSDVTEKVESTYKRQTESFFAIKQKVDYATPKDIDYFLKLLARSIEINGPLQKVLYYEDAFINSLTIPMGSCSKSGFLKFDSIKDFDGLEIFARIHFKSRSFTVKSKIMPVYRIVEEAPRRQQIYV